MVWKDETVTHRYDFGPADGFLRINVELNHNRRGGPTTKFEIKVIKLDTSNSEIAPPIHDDIHILENRGDSQTVVIDIPITNHWTRFKVSVRVFRIYQYSAGSGSGDNEDWWPWSERIFTAYSTYFGDFALDYIPVTILYCPPNQDMINSLIQQDTYGTIMSIGQDERIGESFSSSETVNGGLKLGNGTSGVGQGGTSSSGTYASESTGNRTNHRIGVTYTWGTTLIADNQRAIGRAYWGPLGDIFVLLKNPWFSLIGDEAGNINIGISPKTCESAEILILPAHKLLRPEGDPIAQRIPLESRRRLLELDPFIKNLDLFFPEDKNRDLSVAVDPCVDPSTTATGDNRASRIARYAIGNGVVFDMTQTKTIEVADNNTNETTYTAEVIDKNSIDAGAFTEFLSLGTTFSSEHREFTNISFHNSNETVSAITMNAKCTLIRNQNEADLSDIEIWFDKHFSTFMFRKICPPSYFWPGWKDLFILLQTLTGEIIDNNGNQIPNIKIELETGQMPNVKPPIPSNHKTMTDHLGRFKFNNIPVSDYVELKCNNKTKRMQITKRRIEASPILSISLTGVKRKLNLRKSALWELADALQIDIVTSRRIKQQLLKHTKLNDKVFSVILRKEKLSIQDLKKVADIEYGEKIRELHT